MTYPIPLPTIDDVALQCGTLATRCEKALSALEASAVVRFIRRCLVSNVEKRFTLLGKASVPREVLNKKTTCELFAFEQQLDGDCRELKRFQCRLKRELQDQLAEQSALLRCYHDLLLDTTETAKMISISNSLRRKNGHSEFELSQKVRSIRRKIVRLFTSFSAEFCKCDVKRDAVILMDSSQLSHATTSKLFIRAWRLRLRYRRFAIEHHELLWQASDNEDLFEHSLLRRYCNCCSKLFHEVDSLQVQYLRLLRKQRKRLAKPRCIPMTLPEKCGDDDIKNKVEGIIQTKIAEALAAGVPPERDALTTKVVQLLGADGFFRPLQSSEPESTSTDAVQSAPAQKPYVPETDAEYDERMRQENLDARKADKSALGWASCVVIVLGLGVGATGSGLVGLALIVFGGYLFIKSDEMIR